MIPKVGDFFTYHMSNIPDTIYYICNEDKYQCVSATDGQMKLEYSYTPEYDRITKLSDLISLHENIDKYNIHINNLLIYLLKKYQVEIVPTT